MEELEFFGRQRHSNQPEGVGYFNDIINRLIGKPIALEQTALKIVR